MTSISNLLTHDSRDIYGKLRRLQCEKLCEAWGLPYPANAPKDDIVAILKINRIDPLAKPPHGEGIEFEEIRTEDESGRVVVMLYPKEKAHATANRDIDYEQEIENRAKQNSEKDDRIAELEAMVKKLMGEQSGSKETMEPIYDMGIQDYGNKELNDLTEDELRTIAKNRGIKVHHKAGKAKLIEALING